MMMLVAVIVFSFSLTVCNGDSFIFFHAPAAPSHLMVTSLSAFMFCSGIHGHVHICQVLRSLAKELSNRGHDVTTVRFAMEQVDSSPSIALVLPWTELYTLVLRAGIHICFSYTGNKQPWLWTKPYRGCSAFQQF